jgi:hypothetical protein
MIFFHQLIVLLILFISGFSATIFLFWLLFIKDAPTYDEVRDKFLVD